MMDKDIGPRASLWEEGSQALGQGIEPRITQLRALVTVAREASYTRAARYLSYTESAVYLQIKALERLMGIAVVERRGARIELTPAGEVLHRYALRIIEDVEAMSRDIAGLKGSVPIVVGGGRSTAVYYLTPLIAEFSSLHPEYEVELIIMRAEDLVSATEDGIVDLAASGGIRRLLRSGQRQRSEIRATSWIRGGWALVTPANCSAETIPKSIYVPEFASFLTPTISTAVEKRSGSLPTIVTLASGEAVKAAVLHGLGGAILPAAAVALEAKVGLVHVRSLDIGDDSVLLIHRKPRLLTPAARELLRHLVRARVRIKDFRPPPEP